MILIKTCDAVKQNKTRASPSKSGFFWRERERMSAKDLLVRFPADFSNYAHTAAILIKLSRATVSCTA